MFLATYAAGLLKYGSGLVCVGGMKTGHPNSISKYCRSLFMCFYCMDRNGDELNNVGLQRLCSTLTKPRYGKHPVTATAVFYSRPSAGSVIEVMDYLHQVSSHVVPKHANLHIASDLEQAV